MFAKSLSLVIVLILLHSCNNGSNKEKTTTQHVSPIDNTLNQLGWSEFEILKNINKDSIFYKRRDRANNYLGSLNINNGNHTEYPFNKISEEYQPDKIHSVNISLYSKKIFIDCVSKANYAETIVLSLSEGSFTHTVYPGRFGGFQNEGCILRKVPILLDNIPFVCSLFLGENGFEYFVDNIYDKKGNLCGDKTDLQDIDARKKFCNKVRHRLTEEFRKSLMKPAYELFVNNTMTVSYLVNIGKDNAMRFNDNYRGELIVVKGTVTDIDEPWLTNYKYRVKLEGGMFYFDK